MEDKILPILKYSYDSLKGDQTKSCLLGCALFPEDYKILKEILIEYWICEGIIDGSEGIEKAKNKGHAIIGSLVHASLLIEENTDKVYMHDVVREMALWIASDFGKQKDAFIVQGGVGLEEVPKVENWEVVRKTSLMGNKIQRLAGSPPCLQLATLLLQETRLGKISPQFFNSMPKLAVLDLSSNYSLHKLPNGIAYLVSLRYLNLSRTSIHALPKGLLKLRKLIHLDLEYTRVLTSIGGISSLRYLKVLKLKGSRFIWDLNTTKELDALEHLEIFTPSTHSSLGMEQFFRSHRLVSSTQSLHILEVETSEISLPAAMDNVREIRITRCSISDIKMGRKCSFFSLVNVLISDVKGLMDMTFLIFAPNLSSLEVKGPCQLEDITNEEKACEVRESEVRPFSRLKFLRLKHLEQLKNIYWNPLSFPYLEEIQVCNCPNLKKLPLDSNSGSHGDEGLIIKCNKKKWIEGVEWVDEATKLRFLSSYQIIEKGELRRKKRNIAI